MRPRAANVPSGLGRTTIPRPSLRRWEWLLVWIAESAGWLTNVEQRYVDAVLEANRGSRQASRSIRPWKAWFPVSRLSCAAAAAALLLVTLVAPRFVTYSNPAADVYISAYRGLEAGLVPIGRPLHVHINAAGLPNGPVSVQLINDQGSEIWIEKAFIQHERVDVTAPKLTKRGAYYIRVYSAAPDKTGKLVREYYFGAK